MTFLSRSAGASIERDAAPSAPVANTALVEPVKAGTLSRSILHTIPLDRGTLQQARTIADGAEIWVADTGSPLAAPLLAQLETKGFAGKLVPLQNADTLDLPGELGGLVVPAPTKADDTFLKDAFRLLQRCAPALRAAGTRGGALFVTASQLDGTFGLTGLSEPRAALSGGLAGLAKTAAEEWPEVHCKALDLVPDCEDRMASASAIVEEMFLSGEREVGITGAGRVALRLSTSQFDAGPETAPLATDDLVVISGGARGVTAEVAVAMAEAFQPSFLLLGRSPAPGPEPAWTASLTGEAEIKHALLNHRGGKVSPKDLEADYRALMSSREILRTLDRIESAGAKALYRSADVRDAQAVASAVAEARGLYGPVRGLIHGAGVIADRLIEDKTLGEFDEVYTTKVAGLRALLAAVAGDDLSVMALFSSSTGRYGRRGQVDYAVSNEVLNKMAQWEAQARRGCRVVALNWGPWSGGMVTPALQTVFAKEGIGLIGLTAGAHHLLREIGQPSGGPVEIVVGSESTVPKRHTETPLSQTFEITLDVEHFPFLRSHVIDGRAVLPVAIIVEWLAQAALHGNPGLRFAGFDDLREFKGVILAQGETCLLRLLAGKVVKSDGAFASQTELRSTDDTGRDVLHARATVILGSKLENGPRNTAALPLAPFERDAQDIYAGTPLFHGPDFQGIERVEGCSESGIAALVRPAPTPAEWISTPLRNSWLSNPLALDSSFQLLVLWTFQFHGVVSLPTSVGRYRQFQAAFPAGGVRIEARVKQHTAHRAVADIEFVDRATGGLVARMNDYECVLDASLNDKFQSYRLSE